MDLRFYRNFETSNQILESDTRSYRNRNRKIPIASSERKISDNNLEMLPKALGFMVWVNQYLVTGNNRLCGSIVMQQDFKISSVLKV